MRAVRWFKIAGVPCNFGFIPDKSVKKEGVQKKRKRKEGTAVSVESVT